MTTRTTLAMTALLLRRVLGLLVILLAAMFLFTFGMSGMLAATAILIFVKTADLIVSSVNHHLPH